MASDDSQNGSSTSGWLPPGTNKDERKRYRTLKRKYRLLEEENADLTEEVIKARRLLSRLQNEKRFMLDRLIKLDNLLLSDTDTDAESTGSSESEGESDTQIKKELLNGTGSPPKRLKTGSSQSALNVNPEALGLCVAVVKDRPCKSKALSGQKYCWHHAPLDPNSGFIWCQFGGTASKKKKCMIPVPKDKDMPYCKYHLKEGLAVKALDDKTKKKQRKEKKKQRKDKKKHKNGEKKKKKTREKKDKKEKRPAAKESTGAEITAGAILNGANGLGGQEEVVIDDKDPLDDTSGSGADEDVRHLIITEEESDSDDDGIMMIEEEDVF